MAADRPLSVRALIREMPHEISVYAPYERAHVLDKLMALHAQGAVQIGPRDWRGEVTFLLSGDALRLIERELDDDE